MFMELLDIMNERFSVRKYVDKPVEPEKLDKILNAAHAAPTAANQQPVKLLVVLSPESLEKLGKAANIYGAPVAVIVCADKTKAWKRPFDGMQTTDIDCIHFNRPHDVRSCRTGTWNCLDLLFQTGCAKRGIQTS